MSLHTFCTTMDAFPHNYSLGRDKQNKIIQYERAGSINVEESRKIGTPDEVAHTHFIWLEEMFNMVLDAESRIYKKVCKYTYLADAGGLSLLQMNAGSAYFKPRSKMTTVLYPYLCDKTFILNSNYLVKQFFSISSMHVPKEIRERIQMFTGDFSNEDVRKNIEHVVKFEIPDKEKYEMLDDVITVTIDDKYNRFAIINIYYHHSNNKNNRYKNFFEQLSHYINGLNKIGYTIFLGGDFNQQLGDAALYNTGRLTFDYNNNCSVEKYTPSCKYFKNWLYFNNLVRINGYIDRKNSYTADNHYTRRCTEQTNASVIDYFFIQDRILDHSCIFFYFVGLFVCWHLF